MMYDIPITQTSLLQYKHSDKHSAHITQMQTKFESMLHISHNSSVTITFNGITLILLAMSVTQSIDAIPVISIICHLEGKAKVFSTFSVNGLDNLCVLVEKKKNTQVKVNEKQECCESCYKHLLLVPLENINNLYIQHYIKVKGL